MRPEMASEKLVQIESMTDALMADPPADLGFLRHVPREAQETVRSMLMAGYWLGIELKEAGASDKECEEQCFAHGQHCFGRDPWEMAKMILRQYKEGRPETPGSELAERIFQERCL